MRPILAGYGPWASALLAIGTLVTAGPPVLAQTARGSTPPSAKQPEDSAPVPTLIRSRPLLELSNEAEREFRLLIVYGLKDNQQDWFEGHLARSETLAEFVRDHCLVVRIIESERPEEYAKVIRRLTDANIPKVSGIGYSSNLRDQWERAEKAFVFHRGKFDRCLPNTEMSHKWQGGDMLDKVSLHGITRREKEPRNLMILNPVQILYEASFLLDKFSVNDQTWHAFHLKRAAARVNAPHRLACHLADDLAVAIDEPARDVTAPGKPWRADEFFRQVERARRFTREGSFYDATGPACWLWEQWRLGPAELRPAVLFFVTDLARQLSQSRPASKEKFAQARELALAWRHTGDYADRLSWYALNESLGDYDQAIEILGLALTEPDEGSMTAPADTAAYEVMLGRRWSEPWRYDAKSVAWFKKLGGQLDKRPRADKRSAGNDDTLWEMFEDFRRQTWIADGCRLYAAALRADDGKIVGETTALLFARDVDGDVRRALVATAIAAGVARAEHREWLAASSGGLTTQIREALELALAEEADAPAPKP